MSKLKNLMGIAPQARPDGSYEPSKLALKLSTSKTTDFDGGHYDKPHKGKSKRVIMICTEERDMMMKNGKLFSTGNHPVEIGLPVLHMISAGFKVDIFTPTGQPAVIEDWAMPSQDEAINGLFEELSKQFKAPKSLAKLMQNGGPGDDIIGVFIPGGHGAMLGLPKNADLGALLRVMHESHRYTMALCHGPAALLSAIDKDGFIYNGYEMAVFPDAVDKQTPKIGYLPGPMPWWVGETLMNSGAKIVNKKADKTAHRDRTLITGASPEASNAFGRLSATTLLEALKA